ncbi:MAG: pentapeptide repeat-containing protein [Rhodospirillales bacterium]|nr:pentapeptide repeat-containing protein [Rhodospirillales bacterium]
MSDTFPAISLDVARRELEGVGQELPASLIQSQIRRSGENYEFSSFRRHVFDRCIFDDCTFDRTVGTGARWLKNKFLGCHFVAADMEFADFTGTVFAPNATGKPTRVDGSGFNATVMRDTRFESFSVEGSSFAQSDFTGAVMVDCDISNGTYEGCLFNNAALRNVSFSNANVEFIDFTNTEFENTRLPLMQLAYVFGISEQRLIDQQVQVSAGKDAQPLSYTEFRNLMPALLSYYKSNSEFFALANMALMYGDDEALKQYLSLGMMSAVEMQNFRELKYLCRLAALASDSNAIISRGALKKFHDTLIARVNASSDPGLVQQYALHDGLIRGYLLNQDEDALTISFMTTTDDAIEAQKAVALIASSIQEACTCIGINLSFREIDVATYSNARARLKSSTIEVKVPLFHFRKTNEYVVPEEVVPHNAKSPWHSQSIYMAVVVTTSMLFSGASFSLSALDHMDDGTNWKNHIEQYVPRIMEIRESIKHLVEPDTLAFSEGVHQIAVMHDNQLKLSAAYAPLQMFGFPGIE